jgi:hypothetical protein
MYYSAVSILRVLIVRDPVSSEPMRFRQGCFYAWYRTELKYASLCVHSVFQTLLYFLLVVFFVHSCVVLCDACTLMYTNN